MNTEVFFLKDVVERTPLLVNGKSLVERANELLPEGVRIPYKTGHSHYFTQAGILQIAAIATTLEESGSSCRIATPDETYAHQRHADIGSYLSLVVQRQATAIQTDGSEIELDLRQAPHFQADTEVLYIPCGLLRLEKNAIENGFTYTLRVVSSANSHYNLVRGSSPIRTNPAMSWKGFTALAREGFSGNSGDIHFNGKPLLNGVGGVYMLNSTLMGIDSGLDQPSPCYGFAIASPLPSKKETKISS